MALVLAKRVAVDSIVSMIGDYSGDDDYCCCCDCNVRHGSDYCYLDWRR